MVVGPLGQEIFVDKYGRVKVQFHWHREGRYDASSSCWLRVAQAWAGKGYGAYYWPRVGHEVVVAFEEGDPDRPIVIGSVYNADNMPPYAVPRNGDVSGVLTQSTPGGTPDEYNELSFFDTKGDECIYMRAQRDFQRSVFHDDYLHVGNTQTIIIKNGRQTTVTQGNDEKRVEDGKVILWQGKADNPNSKLELMDTDALLDAPCIRLKAKDYTAICGGNSFITLENGEAVIIADRIALLGHKIELQAGNIKLQAHQIELASDHILLNAPITEAIGVVKCATLQANSVVSASYTPGAGNTT
jgi:type VI secretion system secreted protein VgrG